MKKYRIFIAYFSFFFSCFAYATPISVLPALVQPSLPQPNLGNVENGGGNPIVLLPSQEMPIGQAHISIAGLLELEGENFIQELERLRPILMAMELNSEDGVLDFIELFAKIATMNPEKETSEFNILSMVSYAILHSSYKYFSSRKQEPAFLLFFDSILDKFPNLDNICVRAMYKFYNIDNSIFIDNPSFFNSFYHICNEKFSGLGKRETQFQTVLKKGRLYISRYFDSDSNTPNLHILMPVLYVFFEKMMYKKGYFKIAKSILDNLSKDRIVKSHELFCQNSIELAFLLLKFELDGPHTPESKTRIREILTIFKEFSTGTPLYFNQKIFILSRMAQSEELANLIKEYGNPSVLPF